MKNQLEEEKLKEKFTEEDKKVIEESSKEVLQWLESNPAAEAEEYEAKQKELEGKFNPIMMKVYQAAGGAPGGMPGGPGGMPGGMGGGMPGGMGGGMPGGMGGGMGGAAGAGAGVDDLD
jgi:heat shock protein 1/8